MCIASSDNHWWNDVLENGRSSPFAAFFDIDWHPPKTELHEKVLLPVLGEQYGRVLENQELTIEYEAGAFHARYWPVALPDRAAHDPAAAGADRRRPAPQPPARPPRRPRDREHRHRDHAPAHPLGHRAREGPRAHAREGDRQAAPRRAGRRAAPPSATRWSAAWRAINGEQGQPAQLRPAGGAARPIRPTASATGASPPRRSTTAASSTSTTWPRSASSSPTCWTPCTTRPSSCCARAR